MKIVRIVIIGKVQGVWYRAWTAQQARNRGLFGWVRNRLDGSVEAVFSGSAQEIVGMVKSCHEGPPLADVRSIKVDDYLGTEKNFSSFTIR